MDLSNLPDFDDLPPVIGMPQGCAWGLFDRDDKKDVFGTLNLLTPEVMRNAFSEARDGVSISLNWPLGAVNRQFSRKNLEHKVLSFSDDKIFPCQGFDDEISFNTQISSQWDSLVHYCHQSTSLAYNGFKPSVDSLTQTYGNEDKEQTLPTLNHWHSRGGVVGRGILIDYRRHVDNGGITSDPNKTLISIEDIEAIAVQQNVQFRQGDIIIIRTGYTEELSNLNPEEQWKKQTQYAGPGVESTEQAAKWFWNQHFAAVAGDSIAFEAVGADTKVLTLHEYFLSMFGMPIGELWDLKALSEHCAKTGRYTFLLTSVPLNVAGSVASPANALAIF